MLKSDVDLYIREKRQIKVDATVDTIAFSLLIGLGIALVVGWKFPYQADIIIGIAVGLGLSLPKYFSNRKQLLEALERQVNNDLEAVKYQGSSNNI